MTDDEWTAEALNPLPEDGTYYSSLAERIRALIMAAKYNLTSTADDHYLLDAGTVLPIIEKLIAVAAVAEQLLHCACGFTHDIQCCSEYFQAADDKMHELKQEVGYAG